MQDFGGHVGQKWHIYVHFFKKKDFIDSTNEHKDVPRVQCFLVPVHRSTYTLRACGMTLIRGRQISRITV